MEIQLDMFMVTLEQKPSTTWPVLHEMDYGHFGELQPKAAAALVARTQATKSV